MEDTETRKLVGTVGIVTHVGLDRPFYFLQTFDPRAGFGQSRDLFAAGVCCTWSMITPARQKSARCSCCRITAVTGIGKFLSRLPLPDAR